MRRWATAAAVIAAVSGLFAVVSLGIGDVTRQCARGANGSVTCSLVKSRGGWVQSRSFRDVTGASVTRGAPDALDGSRSYVVVLTYGSGATTQFESRETLRSAERRARELNGLVAGTHSTASGSRDPSMLGVFAPMSIVAAIVAALLFATARFRRRSTVASLAATSVPAWVQADVLEVVCGWSRPDRFPWGSDRRAFDGPNGRYLETVALPEPTGLRVVAPATDHWDPTRLHLMNDPTAPGDVFRLAIVAAPRRAVTSVRLRADIAIEGVASTGQARIVRSGALACMGESPFNVWVQMPAGQAAADYSWTVNVVISAPNTPDHALALSLPAPLMAEWAEGCRTLRYLGYSDVRNCGASHAQVIDACRAGLARLDLHQPLRGYNRAVRSGLPHDKIVELGSIDEWGVASIDTLVSAGATFDEMLDVFTHGLTKWDGVEKYVDARRYASHVEVIEVFDSGARLADYATLRRNEVTHADAIDAVDRGIDLSEYWLARVRNTATFGVERRIPITHAQVIAAHEAGVWLSAYGVARLSGFGHDELLAAHADGKNLGEYTRSKRTAPRTAAEVIGYATVNPIGSGRW
jgi:hypothetical protein